ncbi:pyrethroid hydrolase Ces2e-like [Liolophura sinensis]|uniref:pyrethroid hydrolase Ces2e-like n=1 Tax=Liolophura sinensis TaxID=3198878 RepID=UPI00315889E9
MLLLTVLLVLPLCRAQVNSLPVIRNTTSGQVLGSIDNPLPTSVQVEKYFGIPYATPPVGDLRFEDPIVMSPWEPEVLETLTLHPACPQIDEDMSYIAEHRVDFNQTDEDCLYLNVFVPVLSNGTRTFVPRNANDTKIPSGTTYGQNDGEPLAVLVFIHGGSNVVGTANMFDGDVLAATGGIVVVTINYRLAALGFLGTGHPDFPGNYGILDQIAALRWVQNNIASFNGDPTKVTVMGHSAASMDVGVLLVSPLAKGLFRTAISQSGSPSSVLTHRWPDHDSMKEVISLGKHFNCTELTLTGVKQCLKKVEVIPLLKSYQILCLLCYSFTTGISFRVVLGDKVLPDTTKNLLQQAELNADTFMIGTTRDEAGKWAFDLKGFENISNLLILNHVLPAAIQLKELVRFEYTDLDVPENSTTDMRIASRAYGDSLFDAPTVETLQILSNRSITLHQYRFEWRSDLFPAPEVTGVPHGVDLFYLFGAPVRGHALFNYTEQDKNMSYLMMKQWSHFVKFSTFDLNQVDWLNPPAQGDLPYNDITKAYTRLYSENGIPVMGQGFNLKPREVKFWTSVIPNLHSQINRTLANWNPNIDKTTSAPKTPPGPRDPSVDVEEVLREKNVFLILFIVFLVLAGFLLIVLMYMSVLLYYSKSSTKYSTS